MKNFSYTEELSLQFYTDPNNVLVEIDTGFRKAKFPTEDGIFLLYQSYQRMCEPGYHVVGTNLQQRRGEYALQFQVLARSVLIPEYINVYAFDGAISRWNCPRLEECVCVYPKTVWDLLQEIVKIRPSDQSLQFFLYMSGNISGKQKLILWFH